jgi:hypothetical protein
MEFYQQEKIMNNSSGLLQKYSQRHLNQSKYSSVSSAPIHAFVEQTQCKDCNEKSEDMIYQPLISKADQARMMSNKLNALTSEQEQIFALNT